MFFNSFKEINRLRKEINRLLSKGMSNITIEKMWRTQNFNFKSLNSSSPLQFLGSSNSRKYHWIFKILVATEKSEVWKQNRVWLFYYIYFEGNNGVLKSKSPWFLLSKNIKFNKKRWDRKWKIQHSVLERWTMCFRSYKNCKLKVKLRWVGARERKKSACFVRLILSEGNL